MGITLSRVSLELSLQRAVVLAESTENLPDVWVERVIRMGDSPSRTYVAALGTALLAKATDDRVDALTIKGKAGPNGYSMRSVVKVLVENQPLYGYHLGVTRREPLNNQPWFGSDRVDRFENVRADTRPFYRDLVRYLSDLNRSSSEEALRGLAAFIRVRTGVARHEAEQIEALQVGGGSDLGEIIEVLKVFLGGDSSGGQLGQALVAALVDLTGEWDVKLAPINDPTSVDVAVERAGRLLLAIEVKQKTIEESDAIGIARDASERGADKALVVALAPRQRPLDRERVRRIAESESGVALGVLDDLVSLVLSCALWSPLAAEAFSREFPARYLTRMREHGVPIEILRDWTNLCATLPSS